MFSVILGLVALSSIPIVLFFWRKPKQNPEGQEPSFLEKFHFALKSGTVCLLFLIFLVFLILTSVAWIPDSHTGHMEKIYGWKNLPEGQIIAINGEKGPQARVLSPGFHFEPLLNVIYNITSEPPFEVPADKVAILRARDGIQMPQGQSYAEEWDPETAERMFEDATFFLTEGGGVKGPQTTVLSPTTYRFNKFLWGKPELRDATVIETGEIGVIKSAVHGRVSFSGLETEKPLNISPVAGVQPIENGKPALHRPVVNLYPVGAKGLWVKGITEGTFYLNPDVYQVTKVDTKLQTWEFKGGYVDREIKLTFDQEGNLTQEPVETVREIPQSAEGGGISAKMEGWEVFQELRVVLRVSPQQAPFVVAAVGDLDRVRDNILVPYIRSVTRTVLGGGEINVREASEIDDEIKSRTRKTKVLDVIDQAFGHSEIPPELLVARRREQIADQLLAAYSKEQEAQVQRIETEKAKATAEQQSELVKAEIEVKRSEQIKVALKNEGEGEKEKLLAIAEGQKAQFDVIGERGVILLRMFDQLVENPQIIEPVMKANWPERVTIVNGGNSSGADFTSAAAVLGEALAPPSSK